jgi:hypothetical protein
MDRIIQLEEEKCIILKNIIDGNVEYRIIPWVWYLQMIAFKWLVIVIGSNVNT